MKKWLTRIIIGIAVVALVGLTGVNLYLQSSGFRARVRGAVERRLGVPLEIGTISYLPWRGVNIGGIQIPQRKDLQALSPAAFFSAEALQAPVPLNQLFSRPLTIPVVLCRRPQVTILQDATGNLALPWKTLLPTPPLLAAAPPQTPSLPPPSPSRAPTPEPAVEPTTSPPAPSTPAPATPVPTASPQATAKPAAAKQPVPRIVLNAVEMRDGGFQVINTLTGNQLISGTGIEGALPFGNGQADSNGVTATGDLKIATIQVGKGLEASAFTSKIKLGPEIMAIADARATVDEGEVQGILALFPRKPGIPFQFKSRASGISLASAATRLGSQRLQFSSGQVDGVMAAQGALSAIQTWSGAGKVVASQASVAKSGLLEGVGRYLGVKEFVETRFDIAEAAFLLRGPQVQFQDIHIKTPNLEFKGVGNIDLSSRLDLAARLYVSPRFKEILQRIERQLPEQVIRKFAQVEGREDFYRDFTIQGTLSAPRADFLGNAQHSFEEMLQLIQESLKKAAEKEAAESQNSSQ